MQNGARPEDGAPFCELAPKRTAALRLSLTFSPYRTSIARVVAVWLPASRRSR